MIFFPNISRTLAWETIIGTTQPSVPQVTDYNVASLLKDRRHRWATCWEIVRTDGVTLRFTDHSSGLTFQGNFFTPAGSFSASARRSRDSLRGQDLETIGVISDDAIEEDDLRAGRYRGARVNEYLVDWLYPWAGYLKYDRYVTTRCTFSGERWEAQLGGLTEPLRATVGAVWGETCRHTLGTRGGSLCAVALAPLTVTNAFVSQVDNERTFRAVSTGFATAFSSSFQGEYFEHGLLTWKTGKNSGFTSLVRKNTPISVSVFTFTVFVEPPFEIIAGDTFDVEPGCRRTKSVCRNKFNNQPNFGGFELPGNDRLFLSPTF